MARHLTTACLLAFAAVCTIDLAQAQPPPLRSSDVPQRDRLRGSVAPGLLAAAPDSDSDTDTAAEADSETTKKAASDDPKAKGEGKAASSESKYIDEEEDEARGVTNRYLGVRGRLAVIPQFVLGMFGDGGKTVLSPQVGPELAIRRNGFEYDLWLVYARYSMSDAPFKGKDDPDTAYEIVNAKLNTISIGSDFLWSKPLNPKLQFVYGLGFGIGVVFGDLYRTQSYPPNGPGNPETYQPCVAPGNPNAAYCQNDNTHYPGYKEPSWIYGGQKPVLFPWVAPFQFGLRWHPHPKFVMRLDMGVSLPGPFFFGLAGQYGL